jgi:hypothetical protein
MKHFIAVAFAALIGSATSQIMLGDLDKDESLKSAAAAQTNILTSDFLTGFESGIFLREKEDQVKEYGCPKAAISMEEFRKMREMIPAVTNMVTLMKGDDEELKNMMESLVMFVDHLDELIGVFDRDYIGGDFCAGLTFGQAGSNLLYKMASMIIHQNVKALNLKKSVTNAK